MKCLRDEGIEEGIVVYQQRADERIPDLLATPAALRFVSAEPLLGPVDFRRWLATANVTCKKCGFEFWLHEADPCEHRNDGGEWTLACPSCGNCKCKSHGPKEAATFGIPHTWKWKPVGRFDRVHHSIELVSGIDWIIAGGESGPGAREWDEFANSCRDIRDQCKNAGVPFFMKQMVKKAAIPDDLLIRETPNA